MANGWRGHVTLHMRDSTVKNKNKNNSPESKTNTECLVVSVSLLFSSLPGSATRGLLMLLPEPLGERVVVNLQLCDLENNKRSNRGVGSVTCPHFKERPTQWYYLWTNWQTYIHAIHIYVYVHIIHILYSISPLFTRIGCSSYYAIIASLQIALGCAKLQRPHVLYVFLSPEWLTLSEMKTQC